MDHVVRFVGPNGALELFGVKLVGINAENGKKLLFTVVLIAVVLLVGRLLRRVVRGATGRDHRAGFWFRQGVNVFSTLVIVVGATSIWFDDPTRLATALGLFTAGLAFALQRVVTAMAGYVLILRGTTFNVGDRIVMGGVRGDVVALGFLGGWAPLAFVVALTGLEIGIAFLQAYVFTILTCIYLNDALHPGH